MEDAIALREALINVMVHNDYTREVPPLVEIYRDRLSITSYGALVEGLSQEDFFRGRSMPRNRNRQKYRLAERSWPPYPKRLRKRRFPAGKTDAGTKGSPMSKTYEPYPAKYVLAEYDVKLSIKKFAEYKSELVSATVTGKIMMKE